MDTISKEELKNWVTDYITDTIHSLKAENSTEFDLWASSFDRAEAEFLVNMEYPNDWGYDKRTEIPTMEVEKYAGALLQRILDRWYIYN